MIALLDNVSIRKWWLTVYGVTGPCRTFGSPPADGTESVQAIALGRKIEL